MTYVAASIGVGSGASLIAAPNGKLYAPPVGTGQVLKIDPSTDLFGLVGPTLTTSTSLLVPGGLIYLLDGASFSVFDTATDTVTTVGTSTGVFEPVYAPDVSAIFIPPYGGTATVVRIDLPSHTVTTLGTLAPSGFYQNPRYSRGAIWAIPSYYTTGFRRIDTTTNAITAVIDPVGATGRFQSAAVAPNGHVYAFAEQVAKVNTITASVSLISSGTLPIAQTVFRVGNILFGVSQASPATTVIRVDTTTDTVTSFTSPYLSGAGPLSSTVGGDGIGYTGPYQSRSIHAIDPAASTIALVDRSTITGWPTNPNIDYQTATAGSGNVYAIGRASGPILKLVPPVRRGFRHVGLVRGARG